MIAAQSERLTSALRGLTLAAIAVAVGALVWRPSLEADLPDEATGALVGDSTGAFASVAPARAGDAQRITASNIFAASRHAPVRRFAPGRAAPDDAGADAESGTAYDPALAGEAPTLLGTVLDALGDRALLLAPQVDSSARFYRVGERVGSYRVRRIEAGRVVLDGPTGRLVLELLKPNEARQ
jgi:hypothetical protein